MNELISPADFVEQLKEAFDRGQQLTFVPGGRSMLPTLDGVNDKVTFAPKSGRLKKYDVAFYLRPKTGQLVLHRVIGFSKNGSYIFCGDSQYEYEYGIRDEDILAIMVAFTHKGKDRRVTDCSYRIRVRFLMMKKSLRRCAGKIYHKVFG